MEVPTRTLQVTLPVADASFLRRQMLGHYDDK